MNEEDFLKKRFLELAKKAYSRNICTFSNFLNINEISILLQMQRDFSVPVELYGGKENSERQIARFGDMEFPYPIHYIHISPVQKKFADNLTHRDFLGALMNLGIKREVLGDIILLENDAYLCCLDTISDYIIENLTRIKHTVVKSTLVDYIPIEMNDTSKPKDVLVASLRVDALISEVYNLSRNKTKELVNSGLVFVDGKLTQNPSQLLKESNKVTVRGMGKFVFNAINYTNKKGKINININVF